MHPLVRAFSALEASFVAGESSGASSAAVRLRLILALNQEIGRVALAEPEAAPKLKMLQKQVNPITRAVKASRDADTRLALAEARNTLYRLLQSLEGS